MKHFLKVGLSIAVAACMLLAGCSSGSGSNTNSSKAASESSGSAASASSANASGESSLKGKRVRIVIGSTSTSGDSYMIADMTTRYLSKEMGFNGKVDSMNPARALQEIQKAKDDGTTIMIFHDSAYLTAMFGAVDATKYSLENMTVGAEVGQNPGATWAAKASAPYDDLKGLADYLKSNTSAKVRFNIEAGGSSQLIFDAYYEWVQSTYGKDVAGRIQVLVGGSTQDKCQHLWDGNCDVIFADYSSLKQYTESGVDSKLKMKMLALGDSMDGIDIKTMADQGITFNGKPFTFTKEFVMYFPKTIQSSVVKEYSDAMKKVSENTDFQNEMKKKGYKATYMADAGAHITEKRDTLKAIMEAGPELDKISIK
jgi:tripartite-type tricarboxylate transporter receptor subunit TctC